MRINPLNIVLFYFLLSLCWILLGEKAVEVLHRWLPASKENLEVIKGLFFISITALLLYLAVKRQQQSLMDSENQYKKLFYSNPTPLWIYDRETLKFLDVNDATIEQYGYSRAAFKKMTVLDIRDQADHKKLLDAVKDMADDMKFSGNWQHLKKNGTKIMVQVNSHKIEFEGRESVMVMAQDITIQMEQEQKLQQLEITKRELNQTAEENRLLVEVIDRIYNMVIITDTYGRVSWVNQAFINFTGFKLEEIEGKTTNFLHGPETDQDLQKKIMEALKSDDSGVFEMLNYTKTGQQYWIEMTISGIYNDQNKLVRYISIQNIITERKLSQDKLQQQNKILRKMSWTNSHAIRKPVASIISLVELSKHMTDPDELSAVHGLIGICSQELDEITREVSKMMADASLNE
jgi:PAS domain S-box-containing protein